MGESVGNHLALGAALDGVVTDRVGGNHRFLYVAAVKIALVVVCPDAGVIVGLQFQPDRVFVVIRTSLHGMDFLRRAHQGLDVVADFVGDHVGLGKIARRLE